MKYIVTWLDRTTGTEDFLQFSTSDDPWYHLDNILGLTNDPDVSDVQLFYCNELHRLH